MSQGMHEQPYLIQASVLQTGTFDYPPQCVSFIELLIKEILNPKSVSYGISNELTVLSKLASMSNKLGLVVPLLRG